MNLPVLNGLAFLEAYAQLPLAHQKAIIIVVLTTSLHPADLARAQRLPIAGFLNKPLTREKVYALLHEHFAQALPSLASCHMLRQLVQRARLFFRPASCFYGYPPRLRGRPFYLPGLADFT